MGDRAALSRGGAPRAPRRRRGSPPAIPAAPAPCPPRWRGLLGRYGPEDAGLLLRERDGRLEALSRRRGLRAPRRGRARGPAVRGDGTALRQAPRPRPRVRGDGHRGGARRRDPAARPRRARRGAVFRITPRRPVAELARQALAAAPPIEAGPFRVVDLVDLAALSPDIRLDIRYATVRQLPRDPGLPLPARAAPAARGRGAPARAPSRSAPRGYGLLIHDAYRPVVGHEAVLGRHPAGQEGLRRPPGPGLTAQPRGRRRPHPLPPRGRAGGGDAGGLRRDVGALASRLPRGDLGRSAGTATSCARPWRPRASRSSRSSGGTSTTGAGGTTPCSTSPSTPSDRRALRKRARGVRAVVASPRPPSWPTFA